MLSRRNYGIVWRNYSYSMSHNWCIHSKVHNLSYNGNSLHKILQNMLYRRKKYFHIFRHQKPDNNFCYTRNDLYNLNFHNPFETWSINLGTKWRYGRTSLEHWNYSLITGTNVAKRWARFAKRFRPNYVVIWVWRSKDIIMCQSMCRRAWKGERVWAGLAIRQGLC